MIDGLACDIHADQLAEFLAEDVRARAVEMVHIIVVGIQQRNKGIPGQRHIKERDAILPAERAQRDVFIQETGAAKHLSGRIGGDDDQQLTAVALTQRLVFQELSL